MKLFIASCLACAVTLVFAAVNKIEVPSAAPDWQSITGFNPLAADAYIDSNSLVRSGDNSSAGVLLSLPAAQDFNILGHKFKAKSIVKYLTVDCKTGQVMVTADFYFMVDKPHKSDTPVIGFDYLTSLNTEQISRKDIIYRTLCAIPV